ncbi:MAG: hypothetical protein U0575_11290 [Phycisphaerales bacterium]
MPTRSDGGGVSGVSVVVLIALVGLTGFYVGTKPLQKATPKRDTMLWREDLPGKVPAFLWQDPLQATMQAATDATRQFDAEKPDENGARPLRDAAIGQLLELLATRGPNPGPGGRRLVLATLCNGSAWPTTEEQRIRDRYAIVSALSEAGYVPTSRDFIDFFLSPSLGRISRELPERDGPGGSAGRPVAVPYEWFRRDRAASAAPRFDSVLLLWLRTDKIPARRNLRALDGVLGETLAALPSTETRLALLTGSSDRIVDLLTEQRELPNVGPDGAPPLPGLARLAHVEVIDWSATIGSALLEARLAGGAAIPRPDAEFTLPATSTTIRLHRTIGTDRDLLALILRELQLRGVDPAADPRTAIALVHEQDSIYARSMPPVLRALLWERARRSVVGPGEVSSDAIAAARREFESSACLTYAFLRGVDGQLPGDRDAEGAPTNPGRGATTSLLPNPIEQPALGASERPIGRGQLDYIRRLVADLRNDIALQSERGGREIRAIGVVGSSWEDKIPIVQAIREALPDKLIFTNDLEAMYAHPAFADTMRNLVVASHYDLSLGPSLQRQTPPFRSSYQTSLFLATLLAVEQPEATAIVERREQAGNSDVVGRLGDRTLPGESVAQIAEIGFDGPRRLAIDRHVEAPVVDRAAAAALFPAAPTPRGMPNPYSRRTWRLVAFGAVGLAGIVALGVYAWQLLRRPDHWAPLKANRASWSPRSDWREMFGARHVAVLLVAIVAWAALIVFLAWIQTRPDEEPAALLEGISVWPSSILRLAVVALAAGLLVSMWRLSLDNARRIGDRFGFATVPRDRPGDWLGEVVGWFRPWRRAVPGSPVHPPAPHPLWVVGWRSDPSIDRGEAVWFGYLRRGRVVARSIRALILLALYLGVMIGPLAFAFETPPIVRGWLARSTHPWLMIASWAAVLFVTIAVWDASNLCTRLLDNLAVLPLRGRWGRAARAWARSEAGVRGLAAQAYLTVRLVADRTKWVAATVYFPVVLLLLLALSTAGKFDAWPFRWSVVLALAAPAVIALIAAETLRRAALHLRQEQIRELRAARELDMRTATQDDDLSLRRALGLIEEKDASAARRWRRSAVLELLDGERVAQALPVVDGGMHEEGIRLVAEAGRLRAELLFPREDELPRLEHASAELAPELAAAPRVRVRLGTGAKADYDVEVSDAGTGTDDAASRRAPGDGVPMVLVPVRSPLVDAAAAGEFDRAVKEIESISHGAFAPPLANPVLKAALLPFGGLGAFQLVDYLGGLL